MATFLQLVNDAIRESGADIDQLSVVSTVGNTIQSKFCNWVVQSWEDIQCQYNGWSFMRGNAVVQVYPRIHYYDGTTSYETNTPMKDIVLTNNDWELSNYEDLTIQYFSPASLSAISTPTEGYIDLKVIPDAMLDFGMPAGLKLSTPNTASGRNFNGHFKHWGYYDMYDPHLPHSSQGVSTDTSDIAEIDWHSFRMFDDAQIREDATGSYLNFNDSREIPLQFLSWDSFRSNSLDVNQYPGRPRVVTQTDTGLVTFWPAPARIYTCRFSYARTPQTLASASDTPTNLPDRFHRIIAWGAVMKYALYDEQPALLRRAETEYNKWMNHMRRDLLPKVSVSHDHRDW